MNLTCFDHAHSPSTFPILYPLLLDFFIFPNITPLRSCLDPTCERKKQMVLASLSLAFLHFTWSPPVLSVFPQLTVTRKRRFQGEAKPEFFIMGFSKERWLWKVVKAGGKAQGKWELQEFIQNSLPCGAGDCARVLVCVRLLLRTKLSSHVQKIHTI